jgi:putative oxidoreductase
MLGAVFTAHLSAGFFASDGGFELPLLLACAAVALTLTGPGGLSLHAALLRGRLPLAA